VYAQNYNPLGIGLLSILAAAVPIATLLYFIALHPHRDASGQRRIGISAPWAAFAGVVASFVIALAVMRMPVGAAVSAFVAGALNGAVGIVWIIVGAMLWYTLQLVRGTFEIVKNRSPTSRTIAACSACSSRFRLARSSKARVASERRSPSLER
jgi:lactate permease